MSIATLLFQIKTAQEAKLSSEIVAKVEKVLQGFDDPPEAFEKRLIRGNTRPRKRHKGHIGKTPRTSLQRRHPFDHVIEMHDQYSKDNAHDFGVLGQNPFH